MRISTTSALKTTWPLFAKGTSCISLVHPTELTRLSSLQQPLTFRKTVYRRVDNPRGQEIVRGIRYLNLRSEVSVTTHSSFRLTT
jgi:hypothetical protein